MISVSNVIAGGTPTFEKNDKRDLDVVVGAQAEQRWDQLKKEADKRTAVRKKTGKMALGRKPDGSYVPVGDKRLSVRETAYKTFEHAKKTGIKVVRDD